MLENQVEINFIGKCKKMTFQELESYIEDSFEKLEFDKNPTDKIPLNKSTYDSLLTLLEGKFNNDYLLQIKLNNHVKTFDFLTQIKQTILDEDVEQNTLDSYIRSVEIELENLLKNLLVGNKLASNIMNSSAKFNEKMSVLSQISETEIQKIATDFKPFDFSILAPSAMEKKRVDLNTHLQLENCKKKIRSIEFRKTTLKSVLLRKQSKSKINELNELLSVANKQLRYYKERQYELNISGISEQFHKRKELFLSLLDSTIERINLEIRTQMSRIIPIHKDSYELFEKAQNSINYLRNKNDTIFKDSHQILETKKLPWKLMPRGKWNIESVVKLFRGYHWQEAEFDEERLRDIINLKPNVCYIGEENFEGYVVFCFDWTEKVVFEKPTYGNATYIMKKNWQEISKLSKWEARYEYSNQVTVINHTETWLERLRKNLLSKS